MTPEKITDFSQLDHDDLTDILGQLLDRLGIEVWREVTPDYTAITLQEVEAD